MTRRASATRHPYTEAYFDLRNIFATIVAMVLTALPYVQIVLSILLIAAILLQRTGASLGGAFGSDNFSSGFHTRRGAERTLFYATIALGVLFAATALANVLLS
ncbi:MAG: hypothetical protein RLZZ342_353 [Candidatus Parcubacteria bacterium]